MIVTCKSCRSWFWCMERSRLIPCTSYKRKEVRSERKQNHSAEGSGAHGSESPVCQSGPAEGKASIRVCSEE